MLQSGMHAGKHLSNIMYCEIPCQKTRHHLMGGAKMDDEGPQDTGRSPPPGSTTETQEPKQIGTTWDLHWDSGEDVGEDLGSD